MTAKIVGDENICNFANEIRNHLKRGNNEKGEANNQPRRYTSESSETNASRHRHLRGWNGESERFGQRDVNKHQERIAEHIDNVVEQLGTKERTTVYHSFDELPADMKKHIHKRDCPLCVRK